jgi:excisionase family DNA binding protein
MTVEDNKSLIARVAKAKQFDGGTPVLLSMQEASARLRIGRSTMQQLVRTGQIHTKKIGRLHRVIVGSLNEYAASIGHPLVPALNGEKLDALTQSIEALTNRIDRLLNLFVKIGTAAKMEIEK